MTTRAWVVIIAALYLANLVAIGAGLWIALRWLMVSIQLTRLVV